MASPSSLATSPAPGAASQLATRAELAQIDASARVPALFFVGASAFWLLVGTLFALITAFKLQSPEFLGHTEWLTYGRVNAVQSNAFIYGWAINASFAIALWMVARLSHALVLRPTFVVISGLFWNIGVAIGLGGILFGDSTSLPLLEMPGYAALLLFVAYALIGSAIFVTFRNGASKHVFISQWYIVAALFWFPWLYSAAQLMLLFAPARGTVQSIVNAWYAQGVTGLMLVPMAAAMMYYFLPKILGRPIHSYFLAPLTFWTWAVFASLAGVADLVGSPVPAWVQSAGIGASLFLLVPIALMAINHLGTLFGSNWRGSVTLRFIGFAAINLVLAGLVGSFVALRGTAELTQFTLFGIGLGQQLVYAVFSMAAFGAIYYILPRLVMNAWPSGALINAHFWASALGAVLMLWALYQGGIVQGSLLNVRPDGEGATPLPILDVVGRLKPYFFTHTISLVLILIGHLAFALNLARMLLREPAAITGSTLFRNEPELEVAR